MAEIGLGQVGVGTWGQVMLGAWTAHSIGDVRAVVDMNGDRAKQVAEHFGIPNYFDNVQEMLELRGIDAVGVATPDFAHRDAVVAALEAGKHVCVQKPMATTVEDAKAMVKAQRQSGAFLFVDFQHRWGVGFDEAYKAVRSGSFGDVVHGHIRMSNTKLVPRKMLGWANQSNVLWFLGTHTVDLLRYVLGEEVVRVYATSSRRILKEQGVDTNDFFQVTLTFESGASVQMENSWVLPEGDVGGIEMTFNLYGANETIRLNQSPSNLAMLSTDKGWVQPPGSRGVVMARGRSLSYFLECVSSGEVPSVTGHDGLMNTAVLVAVEKSVESGRVVEISEVM